MRSKAPRVLEIGEGEQLRILAPRHARRLHRLIAANRVSLAAWLPWAEGEVTLAEVRRYIAEQRRLAAATGAVTAGIWVEGTLAGVVALHRVKPAHAHASLGYWVDAGHRGTGLAGRSAARLVRHAFADLRLHRLEIRCAAENRASRAVAERLGFILEGVLHDARLVGGRFHDEAVYGLLAPPAAS